MSELIASPFFGMALSVLTFWTAVKIQKKTKLAICNPLLIAALMVICILLVYHIPYSAYYEGGELIDLFVSPATACLAVAIYNQIEVLKKNCIPILVGCSVGSLVSMSSILAMCRLFHLDDAITASLIPKSVTTPIAIGLAEAHGGIPSLTVVAVSFTGIFGSIVAPFLIRLLRLKSPVAVGLGLGSCAHGMGTSKAIELGETEGAMSGLAMGISGLITVIFALFLTI